MNRKIYGKALGLKEFPPYILQLCQGKIKLEAKTMLL